MRKKGRKATTLKTVSDRLRLLATHCNILDPEEVKETIAKINWKNSTKNSAISDITPFYFFYGIKWSSLGESLKFISGRFEIPLRRWILQSKLLKNTLFQKKITDFFSGSARN
jgi:hypothetical protein